MNKLIVSCMDRRLNNELDREADDDTVFLRNAGANIAGMVDSIKRYVKESGIDSVTIRTHTDCGAMKFVKAALAKELKPSAENYSRLVRQFEGSDVGNLDDANTDVQLSAMYNLAVEDDLDVGVDGSMIDLSKLQLNADGRHVLSVILGKQKVRYADVSEQMGVGPNDSYFLQAPAFDELLPDIDIAVSVLNLSDIRFISVDGAMKDEISRAAASLRSQPFFSDRLSISAVDVRSHASDAVA